MEILQNVPLKPLTTFKIGGPAEYFCAPETKEDISKALQFAKEKSISVFVLGGGSNMLISDRGIMGLVLSPSPKGIAKIQEDNDSVIIEVAAGENWDKFVQYVIQQGWWGIENLSYIPGNAGTFAVQNVGAYGQEASEVVTQVEAYDTQTDSIVVIANEDCGFYYRHSIFNTSAKGRYIILRTRLRLGKLPKPNLTYPDLLKKFGAEATPSLSEIRNAVIEIRNKKYPFPVEAVGGNAGSFFQHPLISPELENRLRKNIQTNFPEEVQKRFAEEEQKFKSRKTGLKISAFLIDICGLKGLQVGGAKINENQPLVVLNMGTATSSDVMELAREVREEVYAKTGVPIPIEPELVGFTTTEINDYLNLGE
jgi:UDP-N-acetylmuramate dehydrogenase